MKQIVKTLAFVALAISLAASFVVFSYAQTKRRVKKPIAVKRQPQKTTDATNSASDENLADCLACSDKPKPEIYRNNPKTKQKIIVSDCEPVNLKTIFQPKVSYPKAAQAVKASGLVKVDVVFDETGKVIWAKVIEGHPLLQAEALRVACLTRIKPPVNCVGQPRKVNPILNYNFTSEK